MNDSVTIDDQVAILGRASRRAALLSLIGFVLVLGALVYAATELGHMQRELARLKSEMESTKTELKTVRGELVNARQAVAASRAAINAFHAGRLQDAVKLYDEALQADPSNAYLQNLRAYALFRLGHVEQAIEGERRSLVADQQYAWGYFDLARFLCAAKPPRMEEAKTAAEQAIALRSDLRQVMQQDDEFQRVCRRQIP